MKYTLEQARIGAKKTQEEMAEHLGVTRATYRKYEDKPYTMQVGTLIKFCAICDVQPEDLKFFNTAFEFNSNY